MLRLLKTRLENRSMHLRSTFRTFSPHPPLISSIPCMILTVKVQILSVDIHLVSARVPKLLFLMASGSTSQIMMHLHSLWSLGRGTLGWQFNHKSPTPLPHVKRKWNLPLICHNSENYDFYFLFYKVCGCRSDNSKGHPVPHVRYESGIWPWSHWPCNVLWSHGWWSAYWTLRWYVGWLVYQGSLFTLYFSYFLLISSSIGA